MKYYYWLFIVFLIFSQQAMARDIIEKTKVAPNYFGPNALPIPDMLSNGVAKTLQVSVACDYFEGYRGDKTINPYIQINIPLYSDRINLSAWCAPVEFYTNTEESIANSFCPAKGLASGHSYGDIYLSTDIQVLRDKKILPDIVLRVGLKTASGGDYDESRHFDDPGYFFDACFAKSFSFRTKFLKSIRLAATGGFLCWQIKDAYQNDAYMYGALLQFDTSLFSLSGSWGGYSGWEKCGDTPQSLKFNLSVPVSKHIEPFLHYQYGLRDFPYEQYQAGLLLKF